MTEKAPMWLVEDHITGAKHSAQELNREKTIERLEDALALSRGEKSPDLPEL